MNATNPHIEPDDSESPYVEYMDFGATIARWSIGDEQSLRFVLEARRRIMDETGLPSREVGALVLAWATHVSRPGL